MFNTKQKGLSQYIALFQAFIAFGVFITIFTFAINLVISPIKKDISHLEQGQKEILDRLKKLEDLFKNTQ